MNLGTTIRKYRKQKKLTLKVVSEEAGISEGFLSQVENNVNSPSVDTLINICKAIGINAGEILNQVEKKEKIILIRKKDNIDLEYPKSGFLTKRFFPPEDRIVIDSAILAVKPGKTIPGRKNIKNSQEILSILQGTMKFYYGNETITLEEGDSLHFWTNSEEQKLVNESDSPSIALWIGTI